MSPLRMVQNFSGRRALLVSADARATESLAPTLRKLGVAPELLTLGPEQMAAMPADLDAARDILFVDGDLHRPIALPPGAIGDLAPVPVVGIVGVEAPGRLKALMQLGATAFLSKPVHGGEVYSALFLAVNAHAGKLAMRATIEEHETRRRLRRFVIKAVTQLMAERGIDDEAAFALLRKESMRRRISVEEFCKSVVREDACDTNLERLAERRPAVLE